jgi:hypothetical protein
MAKADQLRGHCQHCGNQQAVISRGTMSNHGYTVEHGWFHGVCEGKRFKPVEHDRAELDDFCAEISKQAKGLRDYADQLEAGSIDPEFFTISVRLRETDRWGVRIRKEFSIPFCYGDDEDKAKARSVEILMSRRRAEMGDAHVKTMQSIADKYHGKALIKASKPAPAPAIEKGEKRSFANGIVVVCEYVSGARVQYKRVDNGRSGWVGTRSWRGMREEA